MVENKMGTMEIKKLILSMSIPIMISMLIQALYNIVDSMFVARVSDEALTAVSLCYPVQMIIVAVACGTAVGMNTLLSRYLGEKRSEEANQTALHGIFLAICNGIIFAVIGGFFSEAFLGFFSSDNQTIE
ncbi:MAG: MATE family efflux transporter, partial [Lachnospiraceae bacterium]